MKTIQRTEFDHLVQQAMAGAGLGQMRPVVEKELLHYDILFALDREGLLNPLVFQGGTCLRLCYGGSRFSEDLDFAGGPQFCAQTLQAMKSCIEHYLGKRYGLEVSVKEPTSLKGQAQYANLNIDKWQIAITTAPNRPDLPKQKIKLEVANIPAHTQTPKTLQKNYDFLPDGYEDLLINTETLSEIMADKLIALPTTEKYIRYRDIWDLVWLTQQGATLDPRLIDAKIDDYRIHQYEEKLNSTRHKLPNIIDSKRFHDEMRRFIPTPTYDRTLAKPAFLSYLKTTLDDLLHAVHTRHTTQTPPPELRM